MKAEAIGAIPAGTAFVRDRAVWRNPAGTAGSTYFDDLLPQRGKYVVFAISLGNEGILTGGQAAYNQFRTNLAQPVQQARANGIVPVVTNCYTRNDFGATEYAFTR